MKRFVFDSIPGLNQIRIRFDRGDEMFNEPQIVGKASRDEDALPPRRCVSEFDECAVCRADFGFVEVREHDIGTVDLGACVFGDVVSYGVFTLAKPVPRASVSAAVAKKGGELPVRVPAVEAAVVA